MNKWLVLPMLCLGAPAFCFSQTPLAKNFSQMESSDPVIARRAKEESMNVLMAELPVIERDTSIICDALSHPDPYIRLQAAAILTTIVVASPSHNQVVLACVPELLKAATDSAIRVRNDALYALALNPAGPPSTAQTDFENALASENLRTEELGAAGLLKEDGGHNFANQKLVADALHAASDSKHKVNLLYAISGSQVKSGILFDAAREHLYDHDPDVQNAAIDAVAASGDDSATINAMENLKDSLLGDQQTRSHVEAILARLHAK